MNISNYLAILWGVVIVMVSFVLLTQPKFFEELLCKVRVKHWMLFWGIITFLVGVDMVMVHNVWSFDWRTVVTIIGWLTMLKGLDLLLFPKHMGNRWSRTKKFQWNKLLIFLLLFGLLLIYFGFFLEGGD